LKLLSKYGVFGAGLIACIVMVFWLLYDPAKDLTRSVPGLDSIPTAQNEQVQEVSIGEFFERFASEESRLTGSWSGFRGPNRDNILASTQPLINTFGSSGPKIQWEVALGEGHAAPVIQKGKVYILDYLEEEKKDALRCFSLLSGKELWRRSYGIHIKRNHGMSRTTPAISEHFLVTIGPMGHVMCVDPDNGDLKWTLDLVKKYKTEIPFWYTGQCPLVYENTLVLAPGGRAMMIGVDADSGEILWETPNRDSLQMSHSSIMPVQIGEEKMFVYAGIGGVIGVSAMEKRMGELLWFNKEFAPSVIAPSPIQLDANHLFLTAGYGAGSAVLELTSNTFESKVIQAYKPKEGLASEQQTPILMDGYIYGVLPKDAGSHRNQLACYAIRDLKNPLWTTGKEIKFGLGPYIYADDKFFLVSDDGTLSIVKADSKGFELLDSYRAIEGHDAWGPIAIADGRLLMRDSKKMVCIDIRR
jgi:outer membrane protein assembly factor BamB